MAPRSGKLDRLLVWVLPYFAGKRHAYRHANNALYNPPLPGRKLFPRIRFPDLGAMPPNIL
eukprot:12298148-Heterocapsa_arctica.AAC.1